MKYHIVCLKIVVFILFLFFVYNLKMNSVHEGYSRYKKKKLTYEEIMARINKNAKGISDINEKLAAKSNLKDRVKELERKTEEMP